MFFKLLKQPSSRAICGLLFSSLLFLMACSEEKPVEQPKPTVEVYELRGEVRRVNITEETVHIHHEEIPGYMEEMTMPFTVRNSDLLHQLQKGDLVEGKLLVSGMEMSLSDLRKREGSLAEQPQR